MRPGGCKEEEEKMKRKKTTIWCYLDGKKHCDVVQWALAANVMVSDAKKNLPAATGQARVIKNHLTPLL